MTPNHGSPTAGRRRWWEWLAAATLFAVAGLLIVSFMARWPIEGTSLAIDWKGIWQDLQGGRPHFNSDSLLIVPWDAVLIWPLGWVSMRASWAIATLLTLAVLVVSVPAGVSRKRRWLGILLLTTAYPAVRHIVDGNFEGMVITGLLLTVYGYQQNKIWPLAAGLLLATAKVQEAWFPCLILAPYLIRTWPAKRLAALFAVIAVVVAPTLLWLGQEWVYGLTHVVERGSIMDNSLTSTLTRVGLPGWAIAALWLLLAAAVALFAWRSGPTLTRPKIAVFVATSLLLSPYAAGNSYLTILAVGAIPLVMAGNPAALALMVLIDLPYFASRAIQFAWSANYWTALLILWIALAAYHVWNEPRAGQNVSAKPLPPSKPHGPNTVSS